MEDDNNVYVKVNEDASKLGDGTQGTYPTCHSQPSHHKENIASTGSR